MTEGQAEVTEPQTQVLAWLCGALARACLGRHRTGKGGAVSLEKAHEAPVIPGAIRT